jgi:hypothetical protein
MSELSLRREATIETDYERSNKGGKQGHPSLAKRGKKYKEEV